MVHRARGIAHRFGMPEWLAVAGMAIMIAMFVWDRLFAQQYLPQTQDGINATMASEIVSLTNRIDHIDSMVQSLVIGVFVQLVAFVFWFLKQRKVL